MSHYLSFLVLILRTYCGHPFLAFAQQLPNQQFLPPNDLTLSDHFFMGNGTLKRIEAFTLSPFSRNLRALRNFVLKSLTSIVGLKRTSLMLITFVSYELHGLFLLLKAEFPVIHNSCYWRLSIWCHQYHIKVCSFCNLQCFSFTLYTKLFAVLINQTQFTCTNAVVYHHILAMVIHLRVFERKKSLSIRNQTIKTSSSRTRTYSTQINGRNPILPSDIFTQARSGCFCFYFSTFIVYCFFLLLSTFFMIVSKPEHTLRLSCFLFCFQCSHRDVVVWLVEVRQEEDI